MSADTLWFMIVGLIILSFVQYLGLVLCLYVLGRIANVRVSRLLLPEPSLMQACACKV